MNKALLVGYLGKTPELRFTPQGRAVARFSLATSARWTDNDGQKQERTDWHQIVVWGAQAEACGQYLEKGHQVLVEGKIQTRKYQQDGQQRWTTEIVAQHVEFLGGGEKRDGGERRASAGSGSDPDTNDLAFF